MTQRPLWLAVALLFSFASPAFAGPPTGGYTVEFDDPKNGVFGVGSDGGETEVGSYTVSFTSDPAGKLSGEFEFEIDFTDDGTPITGTIEGAFTGKVSGKNGVSKFKPKGRGVGELDVGGMPIEARLNLDLTVIANANTHAATVAAKVKACAPGAGCESEKLAAEPFPLDATDGPWTLDFNVDPVVDPKHITGTATASFADGSAPIALTLSGKYNANKDESKLTLKDATGKTKIKLDKLKVSPPLIDAAKISYKVMGQSGKKQWGLPTGGGGGPRPY